VEPLCRLKEGGWCSEGQISLIPFFGGVGGAPTGGKGACLHEQEGGRFFLGKVLSGCFVAEAYESFLGHG